MKQLICMMTALLVTGSGFARQQTVLFVLSSADTLLLNKGSKQRRTGVFLNEFYLSYKAVTDAGYRVVLATPHGMPPAIDPESRKDSYWKHHMAMKEEACRFIEEEPAFKEPVALDEVMKDTDLYEGIVIPGGQGLMVDLIDDARIPVLLKMFAREQKPTGLICHAPSLILTIPVAENPYAGFTVNSVSPMEEFVIENFIMRGRPEHRNIARQLRERGLKYKCKMPKGNFAVKDRNLVTSQNPYSGEAFNRLFLEALSEYTGTQTGM